MRIGPKGRERLREQVRFHLDMEKSGVPREGIEEMLTQWVKGLLENQTPELKKLLEE